MRPIKSIELPFLRKTQKKKREKVVMKVEIVFPAVAYRHKTE